MPGVIVRISSKQKGVVENKCANVDDKNKRTHIEDVRCQINKDGISGTGFPLLESIVSR
jgi:hypothetical protein